MTAKNGYFNYFPRNGSNVGGAIVLKVGEDKKGQDRRIMARFTLIQERGMHEGLRIRLISGKGESRVLKTITEKGFLFPEGCNIQQSPENWELA